MNFSHFDVTLLQVADDGKPNFCVQSSGCAYLFYQSVLMYFETTFLNLFSVLHKSSINLFTNLGVYFVFLQPVVEDQRSSGFSERPESKSFTIQIQAKWQQFYFLMDAGGFTHSCIVELRRLSFVDSHHYNDESFPLIFRLIVLPACCSADDNPFSLSV